MEHTFVAYYRGGDNTSGSKVIKVDTTHFRFPASLWEVALQTALRTAYEADAELVTLSRTEINKPFNQSKGVKELLE